MKALIVALLTVVAVPAYGDGWTWTAPAECPDENAFAHAAASRLDRGLDEVPLTVDVLVTSEAGRFTARIAVHGAVDDTRLLTSDACGELVDAVALVIARLVSTLPEPRSPSREARSEVTRREVTRREAVEVRRGSAWNGGLRLSGVLGTGSAPGLGIAGELGAWISRGPLALAVSGSRWRSNRALLEGTMSGVDVALSALAVRAGWRQQGGPIRAWAVGELGSIRGEGIGLTDDRTGSSRWSAVGGGAAVAVPIARQLAVLASAELEFVLDRTQFKVDTGAAVYRTPAFALHGGVTLEASWR